MAVYVTQDVQVRDSAGEFQRKFDLTSAAYYGEVKILLTGSQNIVSTVPIVRQILEQLRSFGEEDYILMLGDPAAMAVVAMIAGKYNEGRIKLLKWDRRLAKYLPLQIDVSGKSL